MHNGKPGDERGLIHGRIAAGIGGFLGGGPVGAVAGFFGGGGGGNGSLKQPGESFSQFRLRMGIADDCCFPNKRDAADDCVGMNPLEIAAAIATGNTGCPGDAGGFGPEDCKPPMIMVGGLCTHPGSPAGPPGQAVLGRFGAALEPLFEARNVRTCLPGMVLGKEEASGFVLCYNKGSISNKQRLYPVGRRPLLTGGDMKAISRAARAAKAIEGKTKQLQKMGMLRKPSRRRAPARVAGPTSIKLLESGPGSVQI